MASSFQFSPGRLRDRLRAALPLRVDPTEVDARSFLNPERWTSDHEKGTARANLRFAATWLFTRAYVTDGAHLEADAVFLAAQAERIPDDVKPNLLPPYVIYLVASAAVRWAAGEAMPTEPLTKAATLAEQLHGSEGTLGTVKTFPRDAGWQRLLAMTVAVEGTARGALGDWPWLERLWVGGLDYLDTLKKPSPHGLLLRFWKRLAETATAETSERSSAEAACRQALNDLALSWAASVVADEPWDGNPTWLYLSAWGFERYAVGREPTAAAVNAGLRGDP